MALRRSVIIVLDSINQVKAFSQSGSPVGPIVSESAGPAIGVKVKRSMSKVIRSSNEPAGDIKIITEFLPSPEELALKKENTKVTISLSSESVVYFKDVAKKHHLQYQKIIRQLLDEYVAHQKRR